MNRAKAVGTLIAGAIALVWLVERHPATSADIAPTPDASKPVVVEAGGSVRTWQGRSRVQSARVAGTGVPEGAAAGQDAATPALVHDQDAALPPLRRDGGILTGRGLAEIDPVSKDIIHAGVRQVIRPLIRKCSTEFFKRTRMGNAVSFNINFTASSKKNRGTISDINPDAWPGQFDEPMKECVLRAFTGIEFDTDAYDFSYSVSYPLMLVPPEGQPAVDER